MITDPLDNPARFTHVKLTYFQASGKYYSEGEIDLPGDVPFHKAVDQIVAMLKRGERPGLVDGVHEFHTLAVVYTAYGPLPFLIPR